MLRFPKKGQGKAPFIVNLIFGVSGASDRMKQFATEAEALMWLKEK